MNQENSKTKQELKRTVRDKISFVIMFSVINKKIKQKKRKKETECQLKYPETKENSTSNHYKEILNNSKQLIQLIKT